MEQRLFRKMVKWVGFLILAHIVSMIIFGLFISNSIVAMIEDEMVTRAKTVMMIFNVASFIVLSVVYSKIEASFVEYRNPIKERVKSGEFSVLQYFKEVYLREHLISMSLYAAFQIPFCVFYAILGLDFKYPTVFEQFYIMNAGPYFGTASAILGVLLNALLFGLIFTVVRILFIAITQKDVQKHIISTDIK